VDIVLGVSMTPTSVRMVLVEGEKWRVIRRRETYDDLVAAER